VPNLSSLYLLAHGAVADHGAEAAEHAGPNLFGAGPTFIVAASMGVLVLIALYLKVPKMLTSGLDAGITEIKKQLEEAKSLRAEAEALRAEYASKIANAEKDAAAMLEHARHEADAIVAKAEADTTMVIARREKMAEDKIAAAERGAVDELRARAAQAAAAAAGKLIAAKHGAEADKALVDQAIAGI
jgi:F-type H+-transporting ATPase subunit b